MLLVRIFHYKVVHLNAYSVGKMGCCWIAGFSQTIILLQRKTVGDLSLDLIIIKMDLAAQINNICFVFEVHLRYINSSFDKQSVW